MFLTVLWQRLWTLIFPEFGEDDQVIGLVPVEELLNDC